jgi:hypothetical protein
VFSKIGYVPTVVFVVLAVVILMVFYRFNCVTKTLEVMLRWERLS